MTNCDVRIVLGVGIGAIKKRGKLIAVATKFSLRNHGDLLCIWDAQDVDFLLGSTFEQAHRSVADFSQCELDALVRGTQREVIETRPTILPQEMMHPSEYASVRAVVAEHAEKVLILHITFLDESRYSIELDPGRCLALCGFIHNTVREFDDA